MILLPFLAAAAPAPPSARGYMERLYASYSSSRFNPLDHPARYFTPRLAGAIKEDARLARGEVGYLDGDPVCQCQDPAGLKAAVVKTLAKGPAAAKVRVALNFPGEPPRSATFTLVRAVSSWRIADVATTDDPSLAASLEASNRRARRHRR